MSLKGCLPAVNHHLFKAGVEYTDDCFIKGNFVYFTRLDTVFEVAKNVVNYPPSPSITEHISYSFFLYDTTTKRTTKISSALFYKALHEYNNSKFNPKDLNDVLNKAIEDSFVMYVWFKSRHNNVTNYEVNTKEGGNWCS